MICLLNVIGDVDISNSSSLEAAIEVASRSHRGHILVSFVDCAFADSSCLNVLTRQFELLQHRLLIVAPLASRVLRLLDVASLTVALPVYHGLHQARQAVAHDIRGSHDDLSVWRTSEKKRRRLVEMTFRLRSSPRFRPAEHLAEATHLRVARQP
ncbi:MAG: STAS domain-containing protein [Vulcanimicrobiaceae bacterium]